MAISLSKIATYLGILSAIATLMVGTYKHFDNKFISTNELNTILLLQQSNNDEILKAIKTLGSSFYDATLLDLDNAIKRLDDKSINSSLTQNEITQLNLLKIFRSNIANDRDNLNNITTAPIDLEYLSK